MAITESAKKAIRSSARKRVFNLRRQKKMKTAVKAVLAGAAPLAEAYQAIDKAAKRGVIKKNAAARKRMGHGRKRY